MPKGPLITDKVKQLIAEMYLQHRDWRAKEVQDEVDHRMSGNGPGLSAIQKELTKIRKKDAARSPESKGLDIPWSTLSLSEYPIPPEALPSVFQVWVWIRENLNTTFTIREAQWAARLYAIIKDIRTLAAIARGHSVLEKIGEVTGGAFESHNIDLFIFSLMTGQEITPERQKKILGFSEEQWLALQKVEKYLGTREDSELNDILEKLTKKG